MLATTSTKRHKGKLNSPEKTASDNPGLTLTTFEDTEAFRRDHAKSFPYTTENKKGRYY